MPRHSRRIPRNELRRLVSTFGVYSNDKELMLINVDVNVNSMLVMRSGSRLSTSTFTLPVVSFTKLRRSLQDPVYYCVHNVFHVSLLTPFIGPPMDPTTALPFILPTQCITNRDRRPLI
eukprot:GHVN01012080.1.p1 GENE.GHVN01012080.1~~GHVN01012080.1.p1  ORF type:complete len:119 (+),score=2.41 GHVN01012080.1:219-575(+)